MAPLFCSTLPDIARHAGRVPLASGGGGSARQSGPRPVGPRATTSAFRRAGRAPVHLPFTPLAHTRARVRVRACAVEGLWRDLWRFCVGPEALSASA